MIHLYRRPLLDEWAETGVSLEALITHVIVHEVGHHFGFSDADMHAIEDAGRMSLLALDERRLPARRPAAVRRAEPGARRRARRRWSPGPTASANRA